MILRDLIALLDRIAPPHLAEAWDNVGLIVGDPGQIVAKALLAIDYTPEVAAEAKRLSCNLVIAYHPPIFSPIKRLTAPDPMFDAIRSAIAIYSPHTALDVADGGTNDFLADLLEMEDRRPLRLIEPKARQYKLITFVPEPDVERVAEALFAAGAGRIGNYERCSFRSSGTGTFLGDESTSPAIGSKRVFETAAEVRVETACPIARVMDVLAALRTAHPYEEPAFDLVQLAAPPEKSGQGRIGRIAPAAVGEIVAKVKKGLGLAHVLLAGPADQVVEKAAVLAGAGREHLKDAIAQGAGLYLTGEIPHHEALSAAKAGMTVIATLHSNSERGTLGRVRERLAREAGGVEFVLSQVDRDPFSVV